jgi:hypothetical protein
LDLLASQGMTQIEQEILLDRSQRRTAAAASVPWQENGFLLALCRELQAPLGALVGLAELVNSGCYGQLPRELAVALNQVLGNADSVINTIHKLVEWGRGGVGHFMLYPEWLELSDMLRSSVDSLAPLAAKAPRDGDAPRRIRLMEAAELPLVFVDVARIHEVITNLALAVLNVTSAGDLRVLSQVIEVQDGNPRDGHLPGAHRLPDGQWVQVSVSCAAPDLAPQTFASLDAVCAQPSGQESTWPEGAFGLVIAKRLMALHGSVVWIAPAHPARSGEAGEPRGLALNFALPVQPQQVWMGRLWQGVEPSVHRQVQPVLGCAPMGQALARPTMA